MMIINDTVYMSNGKMIREIYKYIGRKERFVMEFVKSIDDVKKNMRTLNEYLDKRCDPEYSFAIKLIQGGKCFIPIKADVGYRFYPSKFIGYAKNTMKRYKNNEDGDGRDTNRVLDKILNEKAAKHFEFESEYIKYCERLGIKKIYKNSRKYWA